MTLTDTMTDDRIILRVLSGAWLEGAADGLRLTARKKIALLAYLAMDRASVPRDLLAGLIWGDVSNRKARASLRQALSDLRAAHPALQRALVMDRTTVSLIPDQIAIETDMILEDVSQGRLPDALRTGGECVNDILYGFETLGDRFGDWVRDMRKTSGDRILRALFEAAARDDLAASTRLDFAEAAVMLDPMGECTCRFAMQLAWDLGDIGKALQIYAAFYARMNDDLDMDPSVETQDLAARIKMETAPAQPQAVQPTEPDRTPPPKTPPPPQPPPPPPPPPPPGPPNRPAPPGGLPLQVTGMDPSDTGLGDLLVENLTLRITRTKDISVVSQMSIRPLSDRADVAQ
ncbi:BTAD domain-containing putative transcriptional regulator, partial [Pseudooctadecabacter sp.]|uniref:AfsR/SARP family transcriptional regulator n=1 Tax=Pseudooctadecabacter sp. TaxID=1966338 RepID=UPI0035C84D9C